MNLDDDLSPKDEEPCVPKEYSDADHYLLVSLKARLDNEQKEINKTKRMLWTSRLLVWIGVFLFFFNLAYLLAKSFSVVK